MKADLSSQVDTLVRSSSGLDDEHLLALLTFTNGMVDCLSLLSDMINDLINTPSAPPPHELLINFSRHA